jgi:hypothetical protein
MGSFFTEVMPFFVEPRGSKIFKEYKRVVIDGCFMRMPLGIHARVDDSYLERTKILEESTLLLSIEWIADAIGNISFEE